MEDGCSACWLLFGFSLLVFPVLATKTRYSTKCYEIVNDLVYDWFMGWFMQLRAGRQVRVDVTVHLVFVTKAAGDVFTRDAVEDLRVIFGDISRSFDCNLTFCAGGADWVRLAVECAPSLDLPTLINSLKTVSSRLLRKAPHDGVREAVSVAKGALWSPSYLAVAGPPRDVEHSVLSFIEGQGGGRPL